MAESDRARWDERYASRAGVPVDAIGPPAAFADVTERFPTSGSALDLACGDGRGAVWLARRGLDVVAVDVSPAGVELALDLVERTGTGTRCAVAVADLDEGLPPGPPADVVLCHLFRAPHLDGALVERLAPGGLLALAVLSEVGGPPGRFRAHRGELLERFGGVEDLELLDHHEADGVARILARRG